MEKTLDIGGQEVRFKFSLSAFYIFKSQFGYDAVQTLIPVLGEVIESIDIEKLIAAQRKDSKAKGKEVEIEFTNNEILAEVGRIIGEIASFEIIDILNLVWAFAKAGDKSIAEPERRYDSFEDFPIFDVLSEIIQPIYSSIGTKKKTDTYEVDRDKDNTIDIDEIYATAITTGLDSNLMKDMTMGDVVDYILAYNKMRGLDKDPNKDTVRLATQADFDKF